jgi:hypothetical protein
MTIQNSDSKLKMKTLSQLANEAYDQGYSENFKVINSKLTTVNGKCDYESTAVTIENMFRFDSYSDSKDTSILYLIKTSDGKKGTLIDTFGVYADTAISIFVSGLIHTQK